jgi:hypothetical protein
LPYLYAALYSKEVHDPYTMAYNPATLPHLKGFAAALYSEKKYMIKGLNHVVLTAAYGANSHNMSVLVQRFGNPDYNESRIALNYGKCLGNINIGALIHYHTFSITGNATASLINGGFSTIWNVSEKVFACIQFTNPGIFGSVNKNKLRAPAVFNMGFGFQISEQAYTGMEIKKEEGRAMQVLFALQYGPYERVVTKFCWSSGNHQPYFSISWKIKNIRLESGCSYHPVLGLTPSVSFVYSNTKNESPE